jgi:hypothetical protein
MRRSRPSSTQIHGAVRLALWTCTSWGQTDMRSIIGGIIARKIESHKIIFNRLLPIAEQRCLERDLANLGQKVPKHVRCQHSAHMSPYPR